jgi:hypothetical protein
MTGRARTTQASTNKGDYAMVESNQNTRTIEHPRVIDDPGLRETYANKLIGAQFDGGAIVITMGATRIIPDRVDERTATTGVKPTVHVSARLVLSPPAAIELLNSLKSLLEALQAVVTCR